MKKYLFSIVCTALSLSLTLLTGCKKADGIKTVAETEKTIMEAVSIQPDEVTDWEPTTFDVINNFPDVSMTISLGTACTTNLTIAFVNNSDNQCIYGEFFLLEKKINENWYQVPVVIADNYGFNSIGYELNSGGSSEWAVDWDWLYGSLKKGEYRIVKDILNFKGTGDYDTYYLAAEFTIN